MRFKTIGYTFFFLAPIFMFAFLSIAKEKETPVEYEAGFYYTVKKGDTLWDLSQHFSDSPWLWPDLWSENSQLTNPHWIYPGQRIQLFQKNWAGQVIMPERVHAEPTVPSAPEDSVYFLFPPINTVGFLRKEPINPNGQIFNVQEDKELISEGDIVYVRHIGPIPFKSGDLYTVYRTLQPPKDETGKRYDGVQHLLTGRIEITQIKSDYAIARVTQSYHAIVKDDYIMPYRPKPPEINLISSIRGLEGRILFSEEHVKILGDNTIVFIDKGKENGVQPGQFYHIYFQEKKQVDPSSRKETLLSPVDYGQLLVLHTEQNTATVLITKSENEIPPGAKIRGLAP